MILRFEVATSDGQWRCFAAFDEAERWARQHVAASARNEFASTATVYTDTDGAVAFINLDGANRVWTDMR